MKKILLATMIMGMTTGLMGCTKYQIVPVDSVKNNSATIKTSGTGSSTGEVKVEDGGVVLFSLGEVKSSNGILIPNF